jgi:hypothetical protein
MSEPSVIGIIGKSLILWLRILFCGQHILLDVLRQWSYVRCRQGADARCIKREKPT